MIWISLLCCFRAAVNKCIKNSAWYCSSNEIKMETLSYCSHVIYDYFHLVHTSNEHVTSGGRWWKWKCWCDEGTFIVIPIVSVTNCKLVLVITFDHLVEEWSFADQVQLLHVINWQLYPSPTVITCWLILSYMWVLY